MKKQFKGFLSGILVSVLVLSMIGTAAATVGKKTVDVDYNNIKVTMNGEAVNLVDANGNPVEPFAINGTTYLPVRAVANALGLTVGWDQATTTVILTGGASAQLPAAPFTLATGQYVVGEDIPAGKYDCKAMVGSGNFQGNVAALGGTYGLNEILAVEGDPVWGDGRSTFSNLRLAVGDVIDISGNLQVEFTAK